MAEKWLLFSRWGVVVWDHYNIRRCDANYIHVAHVEDLDYDYGDYCRFGRVEKQVES